MNAVKGTWMRGQIILSEPADWPEGCEVLVEPLAEATPNGKTGPTLPRAKTESVVPDTDVAMDFMHMAEAFNHLGKPVSQAALEPSLDPDDSPLF